MLNEAEQIGLIYDPALLSGRMCQEQSAKQMTSEESSQSSSGSQSQTLPMFLCLTRGSRKPDASTLIWETDPLALHTEYTTASFGESPREESVSVLSAILEDSAPLKYYLSEKAIEGILRRSKEKGKGLPEELETALKKQLAYWKSNEKSNNNS